MELHAGTDPASLRSTGACSSIELMQHGAPGEDRTHNFLLKRQALYPVELQALERERWDSNPLSQRQQFYRLPHLSSDGALT